MISVNELIQNAFTRTGLVGDGQAVNGTRATTGLLELNDLIRTLNLQEYIADNIKTVDVNAVNKITISKSVLSDITVDNVPSHIKSVARKIGDRFVPLITSNLETINAHGSRGYAAQFTYNVAYNPKLQVPVIKDDVILVTSNKDLPNYDARESNPPQTKAYIAKDGDFSLLNENASVYWWAAVSGDEHGTIYGWMSSSSAHTLDAKIHLICEIQYGEMEGIITLDASHSNTYRIMFIDEIPEYKLDDKILLQPMYNGLLLAGLSYKLAIRYKVQDWVGTFKDEFDNQKSLIKRANSTNRNMVYSDMEGSYIDNYYNGIHGFGW